MKPPSKVILCKAVSEQGHPVTLKQLTAIKFTYQADDQIVCPVCMKALGNATPMSALISCGHVCCGECTKSFVEIHSKADDATEKAENHCPKCEERVTNILQVCRDGTGFAAGGGNVLLSKYSSAAIL